MDQPYMKGQMKKQNICWQCWSKFQGFISEMDVWKTWPAWKRKKVHISLSTTGGFEMFGSCNLPHTKLKIKMWTKTIYLDIEYILMASWQLLVNLLCQVEILKKTTKKRFEASKPSGCFCFTDPDPVRNAMTNGLAKAKLCKGFPPDLRHVLGILASGKMCWPGFVTIEPKFWEFWICFYKEINFDPFQRFHSSPFGECFSGQCFPSI